MKKLLFIIGLVALSLSAFGQADITPIMSSGGTNGVAVNTLMTYTLDITAPRSSNIGLLFQFKCTATNDLGTVFTLKPIDALGNVDSISAHAITISIPANGTSTVTCITNIVSGGIPGYRLTNIQNTNATAVVTNLVITAITKNGL